MHMLFFLQPLPGVGTVGINTVRIAPVDLQPQGFIIHYRVWNINPLCVVFPSKAQTDVHKVPDLLEERVLWLSDGIKGLQVQI